MDEREVFCGLVGSILVGLAKARYECLLRLNRIEHKAVERGRIYGPVLVVKRNIFS